MASQYHRLFKAAQVGDLDVVQQELKGAPSYLKDAALIISAANGQAAVVSYLVDRGVSKAAAHDAHIEAEDNGHYHIADELLPLKQQKSPLRTRRLPSAPQPSRRAASPTRATR